MIIFARDKTAKANDCVSKRDSGGVQQHIITWVIPITGWRKRCGVDMKKAKHYWELAAMDVYMQGTYHTK